MALTPVPPRHRARARQAANVAERQGRLQPTPCALAYWGGCRGRLEKHHSDYTQPLRVTYVCQGHYAALDMGEARYLIGKLQRVMALLEALPVDLSGVRGRRVPRKEKERRQR
jgi:hypothetical protein